MQDSSGGFQADQTSRLSINQLKTAAIAGMQVDVLMYDCDCVDKRNWATVAGRCDEGRHQPQLARLRSLQQQCRSFVAILQDAKQVDSHFAVAACRSPSAQASIGRRTHCA